MNWADHRDTWPNAQDSQFIDARPHRWHVQIAGDGPKLLLIHGAGGATHSWRDMVPILARSYQVAALDLPGQGFTKPGTKQRYGLNMMAQDVQHLLEHIDFVPDAIVGHSAGAAVMFRMALDWPALTTTKLVSINGALGKFPGLAGVLFPMMAKLLATSSLTAAFFSKTASSPRSVERLITSTGSAIGEDGLALYRRLVSDQAHVDATLGMMAQWSLDGLIAQLDQITQHTLFMVGDKDAAVPPRTSVAAAKRIKNAQIIHFPTLGHLMHEEQPTQAAGAIEKFLSVSR